MWPILARFTHTSIAETLLKRKYSAGSHAALGGYKKWKKLTFLVALPCVGLCALNAFLAHQKQHDQRTRPKFIQYEYLGIRNKRYPWRDGVKTLFHNPEINVLPTGYEK
uniref:Cytochrome c oxidase polypeptide VIa n=1 Tax=Anopheles minimus TaxID=112268 RepID=A0A182WN64_9DIPT